MVQNQQNTIKNIEESIYLGNWNNAELVQLTELAGSYLNLQTIPDYAKQNKLSYNGVKKFRQIVKIFTVKFVIDNE